MTERDTVEYNDPTPFDNTKLQSISEISKALRHKMHGKDVREPIAQQGEALVKLIQETGGNQSAEVIDARGGFETLSIHENAQERAIGQAQNDINVIDQRVNNILKPSKLIDDVELKDSRVGSNGVIYSSVGEAIRNQISAQDKRLNYVHDLTPFAIRNFVQGGLTMGEGTEVNSTGRVRTAFVEATGGSIIVCPGNEYCYAVLNYDKSRNLISPASTAILDNFMTGSYVVPSGTYFVRIVVANINLLQSDDTKSIDPITINELGIMITAYHSALESPETVLHQPITDWVIGSIDDSTGDYVESNKRIRSAFIRAKYGDIIKLSNHLDYEIKVYEYRSNINCKPLATSGWIAADYSMKNQDCCWVKVVISKTNGDEFLDATAGKLIILLRSPEKIFPLVTPSAPPERSFISTNIKYNDTSPVDYNEMIKRYDTLMSDHTDYVTKKIIGKDQSNKYDICVYNFSAKQIGIAGIPKGESYSPDTIPTIILDAGIHGFEKPMVSALVNAMDQITNNWVNDPVLTWLHWNFKIIVVPVANPYGYENNIRVNYNKVDLNRNFNVTNYFDKGDDTTEHDRYRGSSPLSEKESQYINNLLHDNQEKAWLYLNLHTFGDGSDYNKMTSYEFMPILPTDKIAQAGIETIKTLTLSAWQHHNLNTVSGYIGTVNVDEIGAMAAGQANEYGIPSAVVEGTYKYYGQHNDWSTDVNLLNTELIINSIIVALRKLYYLNV